MVTNNSSPGVSQEEAAKLLGVTVEDVLILQKQGLLHPVQQVGDTTIYSAKEIERIKTNSGMTLAQQAEQVGAEIQLKTISSLSLIRKVLFVTGGGVFGYLALVVVFAVLFSLFPLQTAGWLGYFPKNPGNISLAPENPASNVLAASISPLPKKPAPLHQTIFQSISRLSLGLVKSVNPSAYAQVAKVTILDPNDVLTLDNNGVLIPAVPIKIPGSSLEITGLVPNLNSELLQGKKPGPNVGDIAIVGENTISTPLSTTAPIQPGLANTNLSGSAGITNANLANSALTVDTSGPLSGGGSVALGGTLTLSCPTCVTSSSSLFTASSTDTLTNKTIDVASNTISGLTANNLTAGDYSSKITSGTYAIDITGSVSSATNFTGSLAGDVSGTQGATTVSKINGSALGTTTATSGNLLVANGSSWVTQALSGDATLTSSGVLSLQNVGTAGTYGSSSLIPVLTTDAKGRVLGVSNTAISGLTVSNFSTANISQWTNNSGYLTSEADTLASVTGRGATSSAAVTLSNISNALTAGTLTATGGTINGTTIGATSPSTGVFTTVNGLTLTNNGANTLNIAAGKTLIVNSSITFGGTDGTSFTFPTTSDDIVGRTAAQTLTNKTIAAGSNTITGLTNANLANSSITISGNSGSGSVSLGGGLTFTGSGITNIIASGSTLTVTSTESDTLASVTGRGASTSTALTLNGGVTTTTSTALTLDSGTTGAVSLGSGANAKTITIGNTTGATAVNVNSGTGNINFTVDSTATSGKVQIGNSGTATPDLLVLDNGTADPTGVNGGMYYNTTTSKFRCFQNSAWTNCITPPGSDSQHSASYDTNEALTNIPGSTQVVLGTVSLTPTSATGDVYVTGFAEVRSSNATDQPFTLVIETTSNCTGTTVGNASVTYTITSGASTTVGLGNIRVSGIAVDPGTSAQPYSLCASVSAGDTDVLNWGIEALVIDTGADLAEIYTTSDATIDVGDVVSIDSSLRTGMKKSQIAYDQNVLGIVSTSPGLVIGDVNKEGVKAMPVALSGRVLVKVSAQNGPIYAGDYLTSSSIPGVAIKATKAGAIIGTAMSPFDGEEVGQILAFVKNGSSMGSSFDGGNKDLKLSVEEEKDLASRSAVPAKTDGANETNILDQITKIVSDIFNNTVEFFGNVILHGDVSFLGRPTFNKDTAGHALVKAGESQISVIFEKEYTLNPVVTTNINLVGEVKPDEVPSYGVYDLSTKGFKIKLSKAATFDLNFSWISLAVTEDNVSTNPIPSASPSPSHEIVPSPTATQSASPSAQVAPL